MEKIKCSFIRNVKVNNVGHWTYFFMASFLLLFLCSVLSTPVIAAEWPMFMKDPTHTSHSSESIRLPLKLKWKFQTNGIIYSSPVVSGGKVFIGSYDGYIYAIDAHKGALIWKFKAGGDILSTPAVYGSSVFFGSKDEKISYFLSFIALK